MNAFRRCISRHPSAILEAGLMTLAGSDDGVGRVNLGQETPVGLRCKAPLS